MENPCSLSWLDRKLPPSGRALSLDRCAVTSLLVCDQSHLLHMELQSGEGQHRSQMMVTVLRVMLCPWPEKMVVTRIHSQAWQGIPRFFLKWLRRHLEKEQVLKKNYTLELFDFKLHHRIKLCPERNLNAVGIYSELGKLLASLKARN